MIKIKVCGMRDAANIESVLALNPDFMGFIFYEKSPRFVGDSLSEELLRAFPRSTRKVGVFVNAHPDFILKNVKKYALDLVQLHGDEMPDVCRNLQSRGVSIIKAFQVDDAFQFGRLNNYKPHCDYFLFDTKGSAYGGNGTAFDWDVLRAYDNEKPFFLSGGLQSENLSDIIALKNKGLNLYGVDLNSRFETEPALKDVVRLQEFITRLRNVFSETMAE